MLDKTTRCLMKAYKKRKVEKDIAKHRKSLAKEEEAFLEEFLSNDENREWAKGRRLEYLRNEKIGLIKKWSKLYFIKSENWFEELMSEYRNKITSKIKRIDMEISLYKKPVKMEGITDEMIARAKEYPIRDLLGDPVMNKYCCLWHNDKKPSMHYYEGTNTVHCFSCGKSGDSVDVYMELNNSNFIEAVKALSQSYV